MSKSGGNKVGLIIGVVLGLICCCCLGCGGFGLFAAQQAAKLIQEDGTYVDQSLRTLSDSGYQLTSLRPVLDSATISDQNIMDTQPAFTNVGVRLGRYLSLGDLQPNMKLNTNNGVTTHELVYNANFEKGPGTVTVTILNPGPGYRLLGLNIKEK